MKNKDFVTMNDWKMEELELLIGKAMKMKKSGYASKPLKDKILAMIFFNPSLRTRTSLQAGMFKLGGYSIDLSVGQGVWDLEYRENVVMDGDAAEHIRDAAKVLSKYCDAIAVRKFPEMKSWEEDRKDNVVKSFAKHSGVPVINLESGMEHPCQALADVMTIKEQFKYLKGRKIVLTWVYHPKQLPMAVPNSVAIAASKFGMNLTIACPGGFGLDTSVLKIARDNCMSNNSKFEVVHEQENAFKDADIVYAKSWGSIELYGNHEEESKRKQGLQGWMVDSKKMKLTRDAKFMHCLPVRRNIEAADEVIDSKNSIVYQQAENRLHAQNSLLTELMR